MRHEGTTGPYRARSAAFCVATVIGLSLLPASGTAQEAEVLAALEAHRRPLTVDADGLGGIGGEWLVGRARGARFTLIGESHLNRETPLLTAGLLAALRPSGYASYVVESGPETTRLLIETVERGGVAAGETLLTRHPFGIPFLDRREELRTAADALAAGYEVVGVDQEFMGSPRLLLERLGELPPDDASRTLVREMFDREVAAFERFARTGDASAALLLTASADDFDALDAAFAGDRGEWARIVEQLRASAEVYRAFHEQRYYDNNALRVDLIKRNFLAHLRAAGGSPLADHRALIKMGSVHAGRGKTPMHVYDIGNLAAELAFAGGGDSFHVLVMARGSVGADGAFTSWRERAPYLTPAFDLADDHHPVVFDLTPLRPLLTQRGEKSSELEGLQDVALRYDALVLFPRFHPSVAVDADPERDQSQAGSPAPAQAPDPDRSVPVARVVNRAMSRHTEDDRAVVRLDARDGDGLAILDALTFSEGVLELDVRGEDVQGRSFVGIAFHIQNDSTYEAVYVRPFNFRTPDPERRERAIQYVSHPAHPWHRLREESPGRYEAAVHPAPDPDGWVRLRLVVSGAQLHAFAGVGDEPALVVERLGGLNGGAVGFWVGNGSGGEFAGLAVTPEEAAGGPRIER